VLRPLQEPDEDVGDVDGTQHQGTFVGRRLELVVPDLVSTGPRADRGACVRCVKEQADRQGLVRKYRRFDSGKPWVASPSGAGGSITSSPNPVHVGEIRHKGTYPGHPRSIGVPGALPETWPGSIYGLEIRIVGDKGVIDIEDTHRDLCWLRRSHKGLATVRTASYSARRATSISSLPIRPATCTGQATPHATAAEGHRNLLLTMARTFGAARPAFVTARRDGGSDGG
jgi:hypothetical protein